ncbi:MAG: ribosome small subunit biosis GTPase RsgA [Verrucomicrobiota bacterium]
MRTGVPGRVIVEDKGAYIVTTADGTGPAVVPGKMLHRLTDRSLLPKVGDWVEVSPGEGSSRGVIHAVLPRRTRLVRKEAGRRVEEQVLAANVDVAFVVMALDQSFNLRRLERFLVMVREGGVTPVVVLNKADLSEDGGKGLAKEAMEVARDAEVVVVSALRKAGLKKLRSMVGAGISFAFIGTSGVGKSSLINVLYGEEIFPTLEVRESDAKGRHSTTWRELIVLPQGGVVIDTPGMREIHMWMADQGLEEVFPDVEELALQCHFRSCSHTVEKRCAVQEALARGTLERSRFDSYLKLKQELEQMELERREHTFQGRKTRRPVQRPVSGRWRPGQDGERGGGTAGAGQTV